ncbi:hypothetical protein [Xanthomonas arboricola]|uniref:hypothetical protein n=1 Tax=Xanthomonas arboricola TaxID=56448 RepID=UPI000CEE1E76|nr:hypothetical protein [Xanthomonas arboricola]PPU19310.1 hypothetical protein XarbCFBP7610_11630 [Xanthomonas arboricola]
MSTRLRIVWLALAVISAWVLPMRCIEIHNARVARQAQAGPNRPIPTEPTFRLAQGDTKHE